MKAIRSMNRFINPSGQIEYTEENASMEYLINQESFKENGEAGKPQEL